MEETIIVEEVVISEFAERGEHVPPAKAHHVHIDGKTVKVEVQNPAGEMLLRAAGKRACAFELIAEFTHHENEVIEPGEVIDLRKHGLKSFITAHKEIVTIFFNGDRRIERGKHTVGQILALPDTGETVETYDLYREVPGQGLELLNAAEQVTICGCETFKSQVKTGGAS